MTTAPLSATDAFTPAMNRMKWLLFKPFRFSVWWRLAVLGILTGEMSGGFNFTGRIPSGHKTAPLHMPPLPQLLGWIVLGVLVGMVILVIFTYISSILRFVLFDAVLSGNVRIRDGWRRWRERGRMFFPWQVGFVFVMLAIYAVVFGTPLFLAWRAGVFRNPSQHLGLLILGGLVLFGLAAVIVLTGLAVYVLTKDFVIPIMVFEGIGPIDGWRRLKVMMNGDKGSYAAYLGLKAVVAIAASMVMAIIGLILVVALVVPLIIVVIVAGVAGASGGAGMSALALSIVIVLGVTVGLLLLALMSLLSVPIVVFFQSYALHFFGSRYEPLRQMLYPAPPPEAPPASPIGPVPQPAI